jgi:hypothetical protein
MALRNFYENYKQAIWTAIIILIAVFAVKWTDTAPLNQVMSDLTYSAPETRAYAKDAGGLAATPEERKISYNANANIEVAKKDYEPAKEKLLAIPAKYGGYYTYQNEYSSSFNSDDYKTYTLTFKVDVKNFDAAVNEAKEIGEVKSVNLYASDMTDSYTDAKAYLDSYTKEKSKIQELLSRANTVEEIIKVEDKLSEIQRNIDSYQQQVNNIGKQTDYAQISVALSEKKPITSTLYEWTGLTEHLQNIIRGFDSVLVLISSSIGWIVSILVLFGVYKLVKKKFF